jgi:hypothetical protein
MPEYYSNYTIVSSGSSKNYDASAADDDGDDEDATATTAVDDGGMIGVLFPLIARRCVRLVGIV